MDDTGGGDASNDDNNNTVDNNDDNDDKGSNLGSVHQVPFTAGWIEVVKCEVCPARIHMTGSGNRTPENENNDRTMM